MLYLLLVYRVCNLNVVDTNTGDKIRNADSKVDAVNASSLKAATQPHFHPEGTISTAEQPLTLPYVARWFWGVHCFIKHT